MPKKKISEFESLDFLFDNDNDNVEHKSELSKTANLLKMYLIDIYKNNPDEYLYKSNTDNKCFNGIIYDESIIKELIDDNIIKKRICAAIAYDLTFEERKKIISEMSFEIIKNNWYKLKSPYVIMCEFKFLLEHGLNCTKVLKEAVDIIYKNIN